MRTLIDLLWTPDCSLSTDMGPLRSIVKLCTGLHPCRQDQLGLNEDA